MGSARLPGKVMAGILGRPMLAHVVDRCRRAGTLDGVIVATTTLTPDDEIARLCAAEGWPCARGSAEDLLDRYYQAARDEEAQVVVRVTSDCPLIEPEVVDRVVGVFRGGDRCDYASNTLPPRTFPRGLDVEVMSFAALAQAWREDGDPAWREHVTPYLYHHPEKFRLQAVTEEADHSDMRWTVDTPEDLAFVRRVYDHFGHADFSWRDVLAVLARHPEWQEINRHVPQKTL